MDTVQDPEEVEVPEDTPDAPPVKIEDLPVADNPVPFENDPAPRT